MNVKTLKEMLSTFPDDVEVVIHDHETKEYNGIKYNPIESITLNQVRKRNILVLNHWGDISALSTA